MCNLLSSIIYKDDHGSYEYLSSGFLSNTIDIASCIDASSLNSSLTLFVCNKQSYQKLRITLIKKLKKREGVPFPISSQMFPRPVRLVLRELYSHPCHITHNWTSTMSINKNNTSIGYFKELCLSAEVDNQFIEFCNL